MIKTQLHTNTKRHKLLGTNINKQNPTKYRHINKQKTTDLEFNHRHIEIEKKTHTKTKTYKQRKYTQRHL